MYNTKIEPYTIGTPRYATLEDVHTNLSEVAEQLDKMSLAEGVNYESAISDIDKDIAYINSQIDKIKNPSKEETFSNLEPFTEGAKSLLSNKNITQLKKQLKKQNRKIKKQEQEIEKLIEKEPFSTIENILSPSQLKGSEYSNDNNNKSTTYLKQMDTPEITLTAVSTLSPNEKVVKPLNTDLEQKEEKPRIIEPSIVNQTTLFLFSIVGLFILHRALYMKRG